MSGKMDSIKMKRLLEDRLKRDDRTISYDREKDQIRIENNETKKGIEVSLPSVIGKWNEKKDAAIDEVVYYVEEALDVMGKETKVESAQKQVLPVIRSTSFPVEDSEGVSFVFDEHTAETRIFYAVDLGNTYRLIDEAFMAKQGWTKKQIKEMALFNVRSLPTQVKKDEVAGNIFYFMNTNDGYDASRILNESFLKEMAAKMEGEMTVAVPHQDVLIIGDMRNETGFDVLAQMAMAFFANGHVPITALSFIYEDGELEPVFILGKNKRRE
ncbi:DUF1444 domain-containing protein [Jeotgalibacillus campisalis]|uniref:UPF0354 protein KR50_30430 n=1 Tax=Jeotgalibacillus campisalis TaxID=220754 RepID=A0A0C2VQV3_9BACL|nr:DUF1444 domain-containing protein [Jeotgalibacillus campisalis]KIL46368.1 hypothetical protein KR50_30430 [Jeotgalibacillus campisalis]